ncbi:hypothetical protein AGMMS50267_14470 [Spirochaetia bacterium]|nr:hypothetical protein AGMMS50267_14470 [Spirochaetia bacterium]
MTDGAAVYADINNSSIRMAMKHILPSKITQNKNTVKLYVVSLKTREEIISLEGKLIKKYRPDWNIQLK